MRQENKKREGNENKKRRWKKECKDDVFGKSKESKYNKEIKEKERRKGVKK